MVPQLNLLSLSTKLENLIGSTVQGARVRLGLEPLGSAQPTSCTDLVGWARAHLSRPIRIRGPVVKGSDPTPYRFSPTRVRSLSLTCGAHDRSWSSSSSRRPRALAPESEQRGRQSFVSAPTALCCHIYCARRCFRLWASLGPDPSPPCCPAQAMDRAKSLAHHGS